MAENNAPPLLNLVNAIKPMWASVMSAATVSANAAVWMNVIKDWAAFVTVVVGAPTAVLLSIYWAVKTFRLLRGQEN